MLLLARTTRTGRGNSSCSIDWEGNDKFQCYDPPTSKGKQSDKPTIDRSAGSGVIAPDADTITALTEHQEENCLALEFVLRNFPEQSAVVVERKIPRLIIREDLDPAAIQVRSRSTLALISNPVVCVSNQLRVELRLTPVQNSNAAMLFTNFT